MKVKRFFEYIRNNGLKATLIKVKMMFKNFGLRRTVQAVSQAVSLIDIGKFYNFVCDQTTTPFSASDYRNASGGNIILNWVVPEMGTSSGGHINIFRFVTKLQERGIQNRIYVDRCINMQSDEELRAFLRANYGLDVDSIQVFHGAEKMEFAHGVVATSWQTAYPVKNYNNCISKFYFVQDYEPFFYAPGSEYSFAENTYRFGFRGITAGDWLKTKLRDEYGMKTESCGFSFDRTLYQPVEKRDNRNRVFFYARPVTPRRAFELGLLALIELHRRIPDLEVIFAGWDVSNYQIPFIHLNGGCLRQEELSDLYGQCDMCLVLSSTNLSLLPLEVMASNSVVVSNRGDNNEWLLNDENSILTDMDPVNIAETMEYYMKNKDQLERIRENGKKFAMNTDWDVEAEKVYKAVLDGIKEDELMLTGV